MSQTSDNLVTAGPEGALDDNFNARTSINIAPIPVGKTLIITNDFPPRAGGIQAFVQALAAGLPTREVVVYTSSSGDRQADARFDAAQPYPVLRDRAKCLLPTPRVARQARRLLTEHGCTQVLYGAAAPLGLLANSMRKAGARQQVALTHGHEVWWARVPISAALLRRIGDQVDVVTYLGRFTGQAIGKAMRRPAQARMRQLAPGVDLQRFYPGCGGEQIRQQHKIPPDAPLVLCLSRLVPRKGQDQLIRAWPQVRAQVPGAVLLLAGSGPYESALRQLAQRLRVSREVIFAGRVSDEQLPAYHDAANVFAMPCRDRRRGLEAEGLGICYLEAQACAVPVLVGDSGGAPDACRDAVTGWVVSGRDTNAIAQRLIELLTNTTRAQAMGQAGRAWVEQNWGWPAIVAQLRTLLQARSD